MDIGKQDCQQNEKSQASVSGQETQSPFHQEVYSANSSVHWTPNPYQQIQQEGRYIALMLDSGNGQFAAMRLQNDLYQLRPNRNAQNLLLNQIYLSEGKGIGSDLILGNFNPYTQAYMQGYIMQSRFRPFPVYPLSY